ncbi:MAG: hypothetical protein ACP5O1_05370 [Phycisphaerae bacterium]
MHLSYAPLDSGLTPLLLHEVRGTPSLLDTTAAALKSGASELEILTDLRRRWSGELARAALTIVKVSHRALKGKFNQLQSRLPVLYAVPEALEQATPLPAALHKAAIIAAAITPGAYAVDVGCGIGGDSIALARHFPLLAMEISPVRALLVHWNLQALSLRHLVVQCDVAHRLAHLSSATVLHADPARRNGGRRTPDQYYPDLHLLEQIARPCALAAVKVSPAADFPALPPGPLELLSVDGQVVEATLWLGQNRDALQLGIRTATLIEGRRKWRMTGTPQSAIPTLASADRFIFEIAGALTRSGLAWNLLGALQLQPITADGCYATGPMPVGHPALRVFEVLTVVPFDLTRLRRAVASLPKDSSDGMPQIEVKTRGGLGINTDSLQKKLAPYARQNGVVIIYRGSDGVAAAVTHRVPVDQWNLMASQITPGAMNPSAELGVVSSAEEF